MSTIGHKRIKMSGKIHGPKIEVQKRKELNKKRNKRKKQTQSQCPFLTSILQQMMQKMRVLLVGTCS